jgi:hypothetical protein
MWHLLLADAVALVHVLFVLFVMFGAVFAFRWPKVLWVHAPALVWGVIVECTGSTCPLTPLENRLRLLGGESGYSEDFLTRWLLMILYPEVLTREFQYALGALLFLFNLSLYAWIWNARQDRSGRDSRSAS